MLLNNTRFTENVLHNDLIFRSRDRFVWDMIFKDKDYKSLNEKAYNFLRKWRAENSREQRNNEQRVRKSRKRRNNVKRVKKKWKRVKNLLIQTHAHPSNITTTTRKTKHKETSKWNFSFSIKFT